MKKLRLMNYGKDIKRIVFEDTDKRHADLRIRLHLDELKQGEFFRAVVTGYVEQDSDFLRFLDKHKGQSKIRKKILKKSYDKARKNKVNFRLSAEEIESIFDTIAEENDEI